MVNHNESDDAKFKAESGEKPETCQTFGCDHDQVQHHNSNYGNCMVCECRVFRATPKVERGEIEARIKIAWLEGEVAAFEKVVMWHSQWGGRADLSAIEAHTNALHTSKMLLDKARLDHSPETLPNAEGLGGETDTLSSGSLGEETK